MNITQTVFSLRDLKSLTANATDRGLILKVTEKSICGNYRDINEDLTGHFYNRTNQPLLLIADGMGGHQYGEVASRFVHDKVKSAWEDNNLFNIDEAERFLRELVIKTNHEL